MGPAALFCCRRDKLPSRSGETRGVGCCFFLDAVFPFILSVVVIYQPRISQDGSPYALVGLNPFLVGHLLFVEAPSIRVCW
jgi:hypothetical protein